MKNLVTKNARVLYVPELRLVELKCDGFLSYEDVATVAEYAHKMIQFYKLTKCIVNLQHIRRYAADSEEYLRNIWYGKLLLAGVRQIAFVVPEDVLGRYSMERVHTSDAVKKIRRHYFSDEASAKAWLSNPEA
ncbi:hypothetical protein [Ohtaekwangia sp.]|uniref:hypothetical protein n=1 Tax=Ohtaekwangia sp. TaxID=2066019 RepID=UPI002F95F935